MFMILVKAVQVGISLLVQKKVVMVARVKDAVPFF